jgi:hypothetical protein
MGLTSGRSCFKIVSRLAYVRFVAMNEREKVIERDGILVVPAWIGPAKMFIISRGAAYQFGIFALTADNLVFTTEREVVIDERQADVEIKWTRWLAGSGFWIKTPRARRAICFGKPFPDAPGPTENVVAKTADTLGYAKDLPIEAMKDWLFGAGMIADLVGLAFAVRDLKDGRRAAARIRALLEK